MDSHITFTKADLSEIGPAQVRAARGLLGWSSAEAADYCGIGRNTLSRFEAQAKAPGPRTMADIIRVFQHHGVEFVAGEAGMGVVLRNHP